MMHDFLISGKVGFNKPSQSDGLKVCYLTQNLSQFHLACLSCIGSEHNYVVYSPDKELELHVLADKFQYDSSNTQFCFEVNSLRAIVRRFDVAITMVGHFSPAMNKNLKVIIDLFVHYKIPIVDAPHGLFQFGHNFWDDSPIINLASFDYGAGGWVDSFCGFQVNWFKDSQNGPGYPRFNSNIRRKQTCVPNFTLLTTNSNWYLYDKAWQRSFLVFITNYAFENLDELIIWSPHPAEVSNSPVLSYYINNLLPPNLFVYGKQNQLNFYGIECTEDLIACCQKGITTVSTCLVDYELYNKDVVVLSSHSTQNLVNSLKNVSSIVLPNQLRANISFAKIETGYLFPFNVKVFDQMLSSSVSN